MHLDKIVRDIRPSERIPQKPRMTESIEDTFLLLNSILAKNTARLKADLPRAFLICFSGN